ncbi:MAG: hypothetical protein OWR52_07670 [Acidibacillus sp.]|nr:hypothetical protein [Acidibacillus sp.]
MESSEEIERISQVYQQRASTLDIAKRYDLSNRGHQIMYDERYSIMAKQVAQEISRVLKTDGKVLWYDLRYDNPYNTDVRAISIHEIHELFPHLTLDVKKITLLPMITRKLGKWADLVYPALYQLSFLRTHDVALFTKQSDVHVNRDLRVKNS